MYVHALVLSEIIQPIEKGHRSQDCDNEPDRGSAQGSEAVCIRASTSNANIK